MWPRSLHDADRRRRPMTKSAASHHRRAVCARPGRRLRLEGRRPLPAASRTNRRLSRRARYAGGQWRCPIYPGAAKSVATQLRSQYAALTRKIDDPATAADRSRRGVRRDGQAADGGRIPRLGRTLPARCASARAATRCAGPTIWHICTDSKARRRSPPRPSNARSS